MSLSFSNQNYKKDRKEVDIFGDDIRLNKYIDNGDLLTDKKRLNEKDFKYINDLYNMCVDYCKDFVYLLVKKDYRFINQYCYTQYDYVAFMKLIFFSIHIKMSDSSKYSKEQLGKINMCYNELITGFQDFKVRKIYNISNENFGELYDKIETIYEYISICNIFYEESEKTLFNFFTTPCFITHYYRKYGENKKIEEDKLIDIINNDNEFKKLHTSFIQVVEKYDVFYDIEVLTEEYIFG